MHCLRKCWLELNKGDLSVTWIERFVKMYNEIKLDDYIEESTGNVYHYASVAAFESIIKEKKLRFTDRLYLNDKSEGIYCLQLCLKMIRSGFPNMDIKYKEKLEEKLENVIEHFAEYFYKKKFSIYQSSFSCDGDNLHLWSCYSKNIGVLGYNLEFDAKTLQRKLMLNTRDENSPKIICGGVIYDDKQQLTIIKDIVQKFYDFWNKTKKTGAEENIIIDYMIDKIVFIGTFFKSHFFSIEYEYRFVVQLYLDEEGYCSIKDDISFFEKSGLLIPYIDIKFDPSALLSVKVSPTIDAKRARDSILKIAKDFPNLKDPKCIKVSEIPIRF